MPDVKPSPRQQLLDESAAKTGRNLAGYRDGESWELLKDASNAVGYIENGNLEKLKRGLFPWGGNSASPSEVPRYRATMKESYEQVKASDIRKKGDPTGSDAAMRSGYSSSDLASSGAAMRKKASPQAVKMVETYRNLKKKTSK
jgi:hypothetical protein